MSKLLPFSLSFAAAPLLLAYCLKKWHSKRLEELENGNINYSYYECIFFDYRNFNCKPHLINRDECCEHCSYARLEKLLHYLASAKTSISLCMYLLTLKQVTYELTNASQRGVRVRVITDKVMVKTAAAEHCLTSLKKSGIVHKTQSDENQMMHHKFCLIDERDSEAAKAFFGSINLTGQAFCKNFEALVLTNDRTVVRRLSEEFEELWTMF